MMKNPVVLSLLAVFLLASLQTVSYAAPAQLKLKSQQPKLGFKAKIPNVQAAICGSGASVAAALDQCNAKFIFAKCVKKNDIWSCTGTTRRPDDD